MEFQVEENTANEFCTQDIIIKQEGKPDHYIKFLRYPTYNCQLCSLFNIQSFLKSCTNKELLEVFNWVRDQYRPSILLDLNEYMSKHIEHLKDSFSMYQEYINANGSKMIMVIIKTNEAIAILENLIYKES